MNRQIEQPGINLFVGLFGFFGMVAILAVIVEMALGYPYEPKHSMNLFFGITCCFISILIHKGIRTKQ